ncbi:hypothetical protein QYM36_003128 [Artemia franciscana]|uniref:Origin recognition complex subunit 1 n=1 Tax=Artemia franciscana TaxID=6661 RepID=A0AA88I4V1_ARTSF|nr:hypothetical protein QYM36_003128 [Artemia franciscana]
MAFRWNSDPNSLPGTSDTRYTSVEYNGIIYNVGDFVLIANEDVPDESQTSPQFCDVARISNLYEKDNTKNYKFRAKVEWFSKLEDLPKKFQQLPEEYPSFDAKFERLKDEFHSYGNDVDIGSFFNKCKLFEVDPFMEPKKTAMSFKKKFSEPIFIVRFKLTGKPPKMCPVLASSDQQLDSLQGKDELKRSLPKRSIVPIAPPRIMLLSPEDLKPVRRPSLSSIREEPENVGTNHIGKVGGSEKLRTPKKAEKENNEFTPVKNISRSVAKLPVRDVDILELLDSDESENEQPSGFYPDGQKKTPLKKATFSTKRYSDTKVKFTRIRSSEKPKTVSVDEEAVTPHRNSTPLKSSSEQQKSVMRSGLAKRVLILDDVIKDTVSTEVTKPELRKKRTSSSAVEASPAKKNKSVESDELLVVSVATTLSKILTDTPTKKLKFVKQDKVNNNEDTATITPGKKNSKSRSKSESVVKKLNLESNTVKNALETPTKRGKYRQVDNEERSQRSANVRSELKTPIKTTISSQADNQKSFQKSTPARKPRIQTNANGSDKDSENMTPSFHRRVVGTPKSSIRRSVRSRKTSESSDEVVVSTPKRRKGKNTTPVTTPRRLKMANVVHQTVLEQARAQLHVSAVPESLPCRESEYSDIHFFAEGKIQDGIGGCMYISGVPGTGKTATVHEVVRNLSKAREEGDLSNFKFVEVNGMRVTTPHQVYVQIWEGITGVRLTSAQALQMLNERFNKRNPKKELILLLVDELDLLWTRKQDVLYNIFDWPSKLESRLIVLAIANTMDLPERIMINRVSSRLGLVRLTFQPYNYKQLQEILASRMAGLQAFDPDAVQLVARKVAAVSGDARRALDICRRATEIAELKPNDGQINGSLKSPSKSPSKKKLALVGLKHVDMAIREMFTSPQIEAIRNCTEQEKVFLQAVTSEFQRTGIEEAVFQNVIPHHRALCTFHGFRMPVITDLLTLCSRLGAMRLLITEHGRNDLFQRIRINVSADDINCALNYEKNI